MPLRLEERGTWDPREEYWSEEGEPIEEWAKPIIARGRRSAFEMEQVLPGQDPDDPFADPITESNDLKDAGEGAAAYKMLMDLCQADLRCLDAHAHLGNSVFDHRPKDCSIRPTTKARGSWSHTFERERHGRIGIDGEAARSQR